MAYIALVEDSSKPLSDAIFSALVTEAQSLKSGSVPSVAVAAPAPAPVVQAGAVATEGSKVKSSDFASI